MFHAVFNLKGKHLAAEFRHKGQNAHNITPRFIEKVNTNILTLNSLSLNPENSFQTAYEIIPQQEKLLLYDVSLHTLIENLKVLFGGLVIDKLPSGNKMIDIVIREDGSNLSEMIAGITVKNKNGKNIPVKPLLRFRKPERLRNIRSDNQGEYYGIDILNTNKNTDEIEQEITSAVSHLYNVEVSWTGSAIFFIHLQFLPQPYDGIGHYCNERNCYQ